MWQRLKQASIIRERGQWAWQSSQGSATTTAIVSISVSLVIKSPLSDPSCHQLIVSHHDTSPLDELMRVSVSNHPCLDPTPPICSPGPSQADSPAAQIRSYHWSGMLMAPHVLYEDVQHSRMPQVPIPLTPLAVLASLSHHFLLSPYSPARLNQLLKMLLSFLPSGLCTHHSTCFQDSSP